DRLADRTLLPTICITVSIVGCVIVAWLFVSHSFRTKPTDVLQLNESGFEFHSKWMIQSISFERLKELPKFQAEVESTTTAVGPLITGSGDAATTEDAPCAQVVLRTTKGQRFAVQEFYPSDDFLLFMKGLRCGEKYWFVAGKAR